MDELNFDDIFGDLENANAKYFEADRVREENVANTGNFVRGIKSGTDSMQGSLYGMVGLLGDAADLDSVRDWGFEGYQRNQEEAGLNPVDVQNFTDIETVSDAGKWFAGTLGQLAPSVAEGLVTTLIGAGVGTATAPGVGTAGGALAGLTGRKIVLKAIDEAVESKIKSGIARAVAEREVKEEIVKRATVGGNIGLVEGTAAVEGGGMWGEDAEKHGVDDANPWSALALGQVSGLSEAYSPGGMLIKRIAGVKEAGSAAADKVADTFLKRLGPEIPKSMSGEAAQEVFQSFLGVLNEKINDPTVSLTDRDAIYKYINAGAAGAAGGLVFGGVNAAFPGQPANTPPPPPPPAQHTVDDVLNEKAADDAVVTATAKQQILEAAPLQGPPTIDTVLAGDGAATGATPPAGPAQASATPPAQPTAPDIARLDPFLRQMATSLYPDKTKGESLPDWVKLKTLKAWEKDTGEDVKSYVSSASAKSTLQALFDGKPLDAKQQKVWGYLKSVAENQSMVQEQAANVPFDATPAAVNSGQDTSTGDLPADFGATKAAVPAPTPAIQDDPFTTDEEQQANSGRFQAMVQSLEGQQTVEDVDTLFNDMAPVLARMPGMDQYSGQWQEARDKAVARIEGGATVQQGAPPSQNIPNAERHEVIDNTDSVAHTQELNVAPSEAQKEAGNYKKAHIKVDGFDISIENPVGSVRSGKDASGREWQTEMAADYGYFKGTKGKDKDHIDVFIKPGYQGGGKDVYVVNQYNADGTFDEHKTVMGASSEAEAIAIYNSNYETGWTGGKEVTRMPVDLFKMWSKGAGPSKGALKVNRTISFENKKDIPKPPFRNEKVHDAGLSGTDAAKDRATAEVVGGTMQGIADKVKSAPETVKSAPEMVKSAPETVKSSGEISPDGVKSVDVPSAQAGTAPSKDESRAKKSSNAKKDGAETKFLPAPPPTTPEGWQKNPLKARVLAKQLGISVTGKDGKPLRGEDVIAAVRNYYANQVKEPVIVGMWDGHPDTEQDRKKIKAAQSERTNAAMAWLQLNETVMALAELKDKAGYISTAESELAEWLSQTKKQAEKSNDKIMAAAIDYLLVDGKVTLPAKFFDAAYKSAVAKVKQDGAERAIRRSAEQLEESVQGNGLSGDAADNFREGWNHAIAGKSRSSLRLNDDITAGYDAAREFLKTPQGKSLFQKAQKKKLEGTGADLVRVMDKRRKDIDATESTEAIVKKLMAATKRADLFKGMVSDDATPGAQKLLSLFRDYFYTFGDFLTVRRDGVLRETPGEYLGRKASSEDKIKAYLDLRVHRFDGNKTHKEETKEERVEFLRLWAEDYVTGILEITSQVRGENVRDLAVSITDAIVKPQKRGEKGSTWISPAWNANLHFIPTASAFIDSTSGLGRYLLTRVDEAGNIKEAGSHVQQLLKIETSESLKRKTGTPLMPPKFDRVTRKGGKDYRKGRDITPEEFKKTFGFVDVGFGDYVAAQEDQDHLNYSYDAFMDLADLLGLPPRAMSIAGRLYFSIGNLGHGKASAHYNEAHPHPNGGTVPVINVTNTRGDGTVSHEWAHAFDLTTNHMRRAFAAVRGALKYSMDWKQINDMVSRMLKGESSWRGGDSKTATKQDRIDNALRVYDYYNHSRNHARTKFFKDALALDGVKTSTANAYWSNEKEILARSFEAWVADKLEAAGSKNTYLVNPEWVGDGKITPEKGFRGTPYPTGEERKLFNKFYDAMVEALVVDAKTGEVTLNEELFREKAPNLAAENRKKWDAIVAELPQRADDLEREVMAQKKEDNDRRETAKIMKVGDIVEPRQDAAGMAERLKVTFPATVVAEADGANEYWRRIMVLDNSGAEVSTYARELRIVIPAEDVTKLLDTTDLPAEATANTSSELSDADLESIFDEALAEVQESTQEKPDEPPPGADIAADLKVGMWTREDIQEIRDMIDGGKIIMVGDKDLGIPTIHDWPSDKTKHHGFGAFTTETDEYKADWDGGGMMEKTVGGRSYTRVNVHRGTIPFYDKEAILAHLDGLMGVKKEAPEEAWKALKGVDLRHLPTRRNLPGRDDLYYTTHSNRNGTFTVRIGTHQTDSDLGTAFGDGDTIAAAFIRAVESLRKDLRGDVIEAIEGVGGTAGTTTQQKPTTTPPSLDAEQQKTVKKLAAEALKLGVEGIDEAMTGLVKLFGGGKSTLMSFPAGLDEDTYRQAKPHFSDALKKFQAAGQSLKDLFVFLIKNFGAGIKPYALRFAKDEGLTRDLGEKASASKQVAEFIAERLTKGQQTSWQELFAKADEAWGGTQAENTYTSRDAYDAMEMGVNLWLRSRGELTPNANTDQATEIARYLTTRIGLLPTQTKRTKEQEQFQQFSTPPALAYVANWVAKVGPRDVMMEPSAGTGDLAIWSEKAGASLILNELSSRRAGLLRELFPNAHILTEDGLQLNNILAPNVQASVVVMNPPFSSTAGRTERNDTMNGAKHLEQALKRLALGGRLVAIVGEGMGASKPAFLKWWKDIQGKYNVRANISISGAEYAKYGTTFDNQIVVIDNTGKTTTDPVTVRVDSVAELPKILEGIRNERQEVTESAPHQHPGKEDTQNGEDTNLPGPDANLDPDAMDDRGRPGDRGTPGMGGTGNLSGEVSGSSRGDSGSGATQPGASSVPGGRRGGRGGNSADAQDAAGPDARGSGGAAPGGATGRDGGQAGDISVNDVQTEREGELTDAIFEAYKPQRLSIPGAKEHPGPLVQSAAMASVEPPAPTYTPNLPKEVISNGLLSLPQLEAVVYAGQAHGELLPDGRRRGFFIGDNTGVGKGREISGIILDNLRQGRKKAVWVSASAGLIDDARRDFGGIGGDPKAIFATPGSPNAPITQKDGILFITYDTLKTDEKQKGDKTSRSRINQILDWLGPDYDGVIAFDEAHGMGNAIAMRGVRGATKPSNKALAGVKLQDQAKNARVVYVSATGATEVKNLSYATRLGLWGENTPFAGVIPFVTNIVSGGVAAMEMVARDMKALGSYIARSLSFDGVQYRTLRHNLSAMNVAKYDELAKMWQIVLKDINKALDDTGGRKSDAKKHAMGAFWGAQQRFFNQILTAMQTPAMIEDAKQQLADGKSVVVQLTNHYAGQAEREVAQAREEGRDLEELDLTPRQMLDQFLRNSFPTQQYEEQMDQAGNVVMVPVVDSQGNPVHNADAVAARDKLLETLSQITIPGNPIDTIIDELGKENVAEITGRNKRYLTVRDGKGGYKVVEEKRGKSSSKKEAAEFQEGKRRVLIFSGAGATGFSFHADNTAKNKQQRIHYVLQPGWRADTAVQGFGRTHRTNQASAPEYVLVSTDVQAQKRFVSSIARRLDQLGALTKGQRETSGGLFNASDNLESKYGHAALVALFTNMANGYTNMNFDEVIGEMGLSNLKGEQGQFLPNNIPEMTKFLNRLLSLTVDRQNEVFGTFFQYLDEIVNRAIEQGTYDTGLQTIKAQSIEKTRDEVVFTDQRTGAKTRFVEANISNPVRFRDFEEAQRWAKSRGEKFVGWFSGPRSKIFGLVDLGERLDKDGNVFNRGEVVGIVDGSVRHVDNVLTIRRESRKNDGTYRKIEDIEEVRQAWEKAVEEAPKISTYKEHMLVGVLMPIWDRIVGSPKIYRMQTDAGEVLLGRTMSGKDLQQTMRNLGVGSDLSGMGLQEILASIRGGATAVLANGWNIKQRLVSGENRIEVMKGAGRDFTDSEVAILKGKGAFHEVISWKDRVFIPQGQNATKVLESITKANPVVELEGGAWPAGDQESTMFSSTALPPDQQADTPAELRARLGKGYDALIESGKLRIVATQKEARRIIDMIRGIEVKYSADGKVIEGMAANGVSYLVEDGIATGKAWSTLTHELGVHINKLMLAHPEFKMLVKSMEKRRTENSPAGEKIAAAFAAVPKDTKQESVNEEALAYLIANHPEITLVRRVLAMIKRLLVKYGFKDVSIFTPADLRAIAEAAVRKEARTARQEQGETAGVNEFAQSVKMSLADAKRKIQGLAEFKKWFGDFEMAANLEAARTFVDQVMQGKRPEKIKIGVVGGKEAGRIKNLTGENVKGVSYELVANDIAHALSEHGNQNREASRKPPQEALTADDLALLPLVLSSPTNILPGKIQSGRKSVVYEKKINGTIVVVEIVPSAGGSMLFKTAWKRPSEKTDAYNPPGHTPEAVLSPPHSYNQTIQRLLEQSKASKVVDENGEPLVVYHGSHTPEISQFNKGDAAGTFFTSSKPTARSYGKEVYQAYLSIKNPLVVDAEGKSFKDIIPSAYAAEARRKGNDGVIVKNIRDDANGYKHLGNTYIVFEPTQIKSIYNRGTWDGKNPDINFSIKGETSALRENANQREDGEEVFSSDNLQEVAGSIRVLRAKKKDSTFLDRIFSTPEYYFKKFAAAGRVLKAALNRRDLRYKKEQEILKDFATYIQALKKKNPDAYAEANEFLLETDRAAEGFKIVSSGDRSWKVLAPKWAVPGTYSKEKATIAEFSAEASDLDAVLVAEKKAVDAMIDAESKALRDKDFSDEAIEIIRRARELTNQGFDVMAADMRRIIREAAENGQPNPFVGDGKMDEAGRYAVYAEGRDRPIALFASEREATEFLGQAAKMISYMVYSQKKGERSFMTELKANAWARKHSGTVKGVPAFQNMRVKRRTDAEMRPLTVRQALAQMGDLRGVYFPRIREAGEYVLIAKKAGANPIRKHFDIPTVGDDKPTLQAVLNWATPIGREAKMLKAKGYTITIKRDDSPAEEVFEATNLVSSLDAIMQSSMSVINKNSSVEIAAGQHINQILTMQIADIFKQRGYLSSRMRRLAGDEVWEGYEEDMAKALVQYGKNVASGTAKRDTARAMILAFTGRDYSWAEYKSEVDKPEWAEYMKIVEERRIDERTQKNLFRDVRNFMVDILRNDEQSDRIIGTLKGLAVLKYLGFRVSSAAINMTNMVQGVPATLAGHTGESVPEALGRVISAATVYGKYLAGKASADDKRIFEHISANGWDEAQFNYEAASVLRSKVGETWNKFMTASMFLFGAAEKTNRATTIYAAYKAIREKEPTAEESVVWEKAKEVSDRAHGIYGKETLPSWARGKYNVLRLTYTFQKFSHNYMLNLIDLGFSRKEYQAAAWMLLSPALLAGSGATLAAPVLFAAAGALGLGGDDPEEAWYAWAEETFGGGAFARHGLFGLVGVNVKGSLSMGLPTPADLQNMKMIDVLGPVGGVVSDITKGVGHILKGEMAKGTEALLPTAFGSAIKASREATEGITTSNYGTVFYGDEPLKADTADAFLRFLSFNPSRISGIREKQWNEKEVAQRYQDEKSAIYSKIKQLHLNGERITPELLKTIKAYNDRVIASGRRDIKPITPSGIREMLKRNNRPSKLEQSRRL